MAFGMSARCRARIPQGTAAMAYAYLNNAKDEQAPNALISTAKKTVIREPMLIQRPGNFTEIAESNTLRRANQILTGATKRKHEKRSCFLCVKTLCIYFQLVAQHHQVIQRCLRQ